MAEITIKVNGEAVELTEFPSEIITSTILGMLKALRGVGEVEKVEIVIKNN